jgi:Ca2+/Na+ antiporter
MFALLFRARSLLLPTILYFKNSQFKFGSLQLFASTFGLVLGSRYYVPSTVLAPVLFTWATIWEDLLTHLVAVRVGTGSVVVSRFFVNGVV